LHHTFGDEILHHAGYPELCFSSYFVLPEGQQIEFSGSEQQFIGSLESILNGNSDGMETDAEFEEFIASSLRSLSSEYVDKGEMEEDEEPFFEMQLKALAESMNLPESVYE